MVAVRNLHRAKDPRALSDREELVAQMVGCGRSNKEIAHHLGVSRETVSTHLKNVLRKMRCRSRKDLIRWVSAENVEFAFTMDDLEIGVLTEPAEAPAPTRFEPDGG